MSDPTQRTQPKYSGVRDHILALIAHGTVRPGETIPGEMELAERLGVSRNTVRRALSDLVSTGVVERTRGRGTVFLGHPSPAVQTKIVGIVTGTMAYSIYTELIHGIEDGLYRGGYSMILANGNNDHDKEQESISRMLDQGASGLIIEPHMSGLLQPDDAFFKALDSLRIPVLTLNCAIPGLNGSSVTVDDEGIGRRAGEHLIARGHSRIACLYMSDSQAGRLRFRGLRRALVDAGIAPNEKHLLGFSSAELGTRPGAELTARLMNSKPRPTAIFYFNDGMAMQGLERLSNDGYRVPDDVSIVGVDNIRESVLTVPPLSTFNHPKYLMGRIAADMMLDRLGNADYNSNNRVSILPDLIRRGSVADI